MTHVETTPTALSINHQGQFPAVTLSFNLAPGASIGDAVKAVNQAVKKMNPPGSLNSSFQGSAASFQASLANEPY